ncbi:MAG: hypothetical protein LBU17_08680 [Treponema sp.]|jgi:tetratricopeptide (TPR) repeat protein|nr:hypothetical protein [Treponema sp.]
MAILRVLSVLWFVTVLCFPAYGEQNQWKDEKGDAGIAAKYVDWAQAAIDAGRWADALVALERGSDFADVSSDISYLLACVRAHEDAPTRAVLETLRRALEANQWNRFSSEVARLFEAEILIRLRNYAEALHILAVLPSNAYTAYLQLLALKGTGDRESFRALMAKTLEAYPRDPRPVRLLFDYADQFPAGDDVPLVALALRRLPALLKVDRELAYRGVPFIHNIEAARTIIGAYRATNDGVPASIPAALYLGLIDETQAIDELFHPYKEALLGGLGGLDPPKEVTLNKSLLQPVWALLRHDEGRESFKRNLLRFSGVITEDMDQDGYVESWVRYKDGMITGYSHDTDQDGLPELIVSFMAGVPIGAEFFSGESVADRVKAAVQWETYPAVLETELEGVRYHARFREFFFAPLRFTVLFESGFLYPEWDALGGNLSRRNLLSSATLVERPGKEIKGTIEQMDFAQGIPQKARVFLDGQLVSEIIFQLGRPTIQRIDLDMDGRMETTRRLYQVQGDADPVNYKLIIEFSESDWDGDGICEYSEQYVFKDDAELRILRSWDMDRDGRREYVETVMRD